MANNFCKWVHLYICIEIENLLLKATKPFFMHHSANISLLSGVLSTKPLTRRELRAFFLQIFLLS